MRRTLKRFRQAICTQNRTVSWLLTRRAGGGNLQETRLYTFADDEKKVVCLIAIGDKDTQHSEAEYSKAFVISSRKTIEPD